MKKHFLRMADVSRDEVRWIFKETTRLKSTRGLEQHGKPLAGQVWGLIFSKPSTRTRVSFEVALRELGAQVIFLSAQEIQLGRGEPIRDTARVLGRMLHGAVIRTFAQRDVEEFAERSKIPTINALTDDEHPCQILTDIYTFEEKRGSIEGRRVAYIGDAASNVACSWAYAAELMQFHFICAAPQGYECPVKNPWVKNVRSPQEAAQEADVLYTDVWVSMGQEEQAAKRIQDFSGYQIDRKLLDQANPEALVLHCLPAYRGKEISEEVLELRAQDIFDEAENRLHVQKGVIQWMLRSS